MPALNVKMLGSDFERQSDGEIVSKQLYRLASVFGDPWGKDATLLQQMANEWLEALSDLPAATVEAGVSGWIRNGDRWPKPADIRKAAERQVHDRVAKVSGERKVHERRLNPTDAMIAYRYETSPLRRNANWDKFMDAIHPTAEHNYFVKARLGDFEHILILAHPFHVEWVNRNLGDQMEKHFGRRVFVRT